MHTMYQGEGLRECGRRGRHVCMVPCGESSALGRFVNFRLFSPGAPLLAAHREAAVGTREGAVRLMSERGRTRTASGVEKGRKR